MAIQAIYRGGGAEIRRTAGAALSEGEVVQAPNGKAGVVCGPGGVANGDRYTLRLEGQFDVVCDSAATWSAGVPLWWDDTEGEAVATKPTTGTYWRLGTALAAKTSGQTTNLVLLNEFPRVIQHEYTVTADDATANGASIVIPGINGIVGRPHVVARSSAGTYKHAAGNITVTVSGVTVTTADVGSNYDHTATDVLLVTATVY